MSQLWALGASLALAGQFTAPLNVHLPGTSRETAGQIGRRAHTNHLVLTGTPLFQPFSRATGPAGFGPQQIRSAYGVQGYGGNAIAVVEAFDYPNALQDFNRFSWNFGWPIETGVAATNSTNTYLQVVYAAGYKPAPNAGWNQEAALDIEWAHAVAPGAKIYLVEAASDSYSDLLIGALIASSIPDVHEVSLSWGGSEFSGEQIYDAYFNQPRVTYYAATGDNGARPEYPSTSPNVVAVGGTTLSLLNGVYGSESAWIYGGGGPSRYESLPSYQAGLRNRHRLTPDISADSDPKTGVAVFDSIPYEGQSGWMVFGGTSLASPICAAIANTAFYQRGLGELTWIYSRTSLFHDIVTGGAGFGEGGYIYPAVPGYDMATGVGSPRATGSL